MSGTYAPNPALQFLDNNGDPATSYQLFTYLAGTTTKVTTYTDVGLTVANANPIVLDAAGRCTILLSPAVSYKFVLATSTDTDPPASPVWSRDNVKGVPLTEVQSTISGTAGEAIAAGECIYLSEGDGSRTSGRWYLADADNDYSSSTANSLGFATAAIASGEDGEILISGRLEGFSGLTAGTLYFVSATAGDITSTGPTNLRAVGEADSTTSLIVQISDVPNVWTNLPDASATVEGIVNLSAQTLGDGLKHFKQRPTFDPGTSDASGMTLGAEGLRAIYASSSGTGNTAATETQLWTAAIAANTLDANGAALVVYASGTTGNTASADKRIRIRFGTASLSGTVVFDTGAGTAQNMLWRLRFTLYRTGASAEFGEGTLHAHTSGSWDANALEALSQGTAAIDLTGASLIEITGAGTNADDVKIQSARLSIITPP